MFFQPMPSSWKWGLKPRPLTGVANFPSSDSEYGKGFRDGCVAGWDSVGKGVTTDLKQVYEYKRLKNLLTITRAGLKDMNTVLVF